MTMLRTLTIICVLCTVGLGSLFYYAWRPAPLPETMRAVGTTLHQVIGSAASDPDLHVLSVATYNVRYGLHPRPDEGHILTEQEVRHNLDQIVADLWELRPDVIALQDIDYQSARTHHINQLAYLQERLNYRHAAYAVTWNHRYVPWPFSSPAGRVGQVIAGQAVLSRYRVTNHQITRFSRPPHASWWSLRFSPRRTAQRVTFDVNGHDIVVWAAHLEPTDAPTRRRQGLGLVTHLLKDGAPHLVVLGDFASTSHVKPGASIQESPEVVQLLTGKAGFINVEDPQTAYSFPSWDPVKKVDHVFSRPSFPAIRSGVLVNATGSSHFPVWAEFALPPLATR